MGDQLRAPLNPQHDSSVMVTFAVCAVVRYRIKKVEYDSMH